MSPRFKKIANFYIKWSIFIDLFLSVGITYGLWELCRNCEFCPQSSAGVVQDIASELIGASIGVAGFIIAALTIIITMRDKTTVKPLDEHENGMELFFNSPGFGQLTKVFLYAAIQSIIIFLGFIIAKYFGDRIGSTYLSAIVFICVLLLVFLVSRCLYLLWSVIRIQINTQAKLDSKVKESRHGEEG